MALDSFFMREEERKMKDAALKLDFEQAIIHRDKFRELEQKLNEAEAKKPVTPKVVHIKTKQEFDSSNPPIEVKKKKSKKDKKSKPDESTIELLEDMLGFAKDGTIQAVCVLAGYEINGRIIEIDNAMSDKVIDNIRMFVGGAHTLSADLLGIEGDLFDDDDEIED